MNLSHQLLRTANPRHIATRLVAVVDSGVTGSVDNSAVEVVGASDMVNHLIDDSNSGVDRTGAQRTT